MRFLSPAFILVSAIIVRVQAQQDAWPWIMDGPEVTSVLLMGDCNFQFRENPEEAFMQVMPTLNAADFRILNLEGPFAGSSTDPNVPDIPHKAWKHSEPDQVAALTAAKIDAVGVANNVTYPWQALMRSLDVLNKAGIPHAGGGENLDKPGQPPKVITWLNDASRMHMVEDIRKLRKQVDIVIVSYHWGVSNTTDAVSYQSDIGQAVIDAGANLVFGHGPHKYQKIEIHNGKPIIHSVAQFVFDDRVSDRNTRFREGMLLRVAIRDKKIQGISMVPSWREDDNNVRLYDPNTGKGNYHSGFGILIDLHRYE